MFLFRLVYNKPSVRQNGASYTTMLLSFPETHITVILG